MPEFENAIEGTEPRFPTLIDNTMRKTFRKCERRFFYEHILGIRPRDGQSVHLVAGAAYARGLEVFRIAYYGPRQLSFEDALIEGLIALTKEYGDYEPPGDSPKTWERMATAFICYFEDFPPSMDYLKPYIPAEGANPMVEFTFAIELPIEHPVTGDPILYGGKFDMIAQIGGSDGPLAVYDDKTTGQLSHNWAKGWELESQFTGYTFGAKSHGYDIREVRIRGAGIQKTQLPFLEVPTQRFQFQLDRWWLQLLRDVQRMKKCWEMGYFDYDLGDACALFGGCPFMTLDTVREPSQWMNHYEFHRWIPVESEP